MVKIALIGASGRMGKAIAKIAYKDKDCDIVSAIDVKSSPSIGVPVYDNAGIVNGGGAKITSDIASAKDADILIDFTSAKATMENLASYVKLGKPLLIASTGISNDEKIEIKKASKKIAILLSANMSLGVNILLKLVELATEKLKGYDIEILETHHKMKKDSPSGTAIAIAEAAARGAKLNLDKVARYERHGIIGERKENEIGIQALRGGDVVGDHTLYLFGEFERLELTHRASSRDVFADGAIASAKWLKGKKPKLYSMSDMLGL